MSSEEISMRYASLNDRPLHGRQVLVLSPTPTHPQDAGNRNRIHAICTELKRRGATLYFLYYPGEWWNSLELDAMREMSAEWDFFQVIPTTRPLHAPAQAEYHTADEWWDSALEDYLRWIFSQRNFDIFIVEYTYLSKAFEFAPEHVFCILDTHDKFSWRKELLESGGVAKEFYYTTEEQEALALGRADLIWAIKDKEAEFFSKITDKPIVTLPHLESRVSLPRNPQTKDGEFLVAGIIGARNSINHVNTRCFLTLALRRFRQAFAPIQVLLAGGMCEDLEDFRGDGQVQLLGRVKDITDFYASVDLVIVPVTFSTGLKIKAVEGLAYGMPMVAHKHAMEGIPTEHPFHQCADIAEIAERCIQIAFERNLLSDLKEASLLAHWRISRQVAEGFSETQRYIGREPAFVVSVGEQFCGRSSIYRQYLAQVSAFLQRYGHVLLYVDSVSGPFNAKDAFEFVRHNNLHCTFVFSERCARRFLDQSGGAWNTTKCLGVTYFVDDLEGICRRRNIIGLWLSSILPELCKSELPSRIRSLPAFCRIDALKLYGQLDNPRISLLLSNLENIYLLDCSDTLHVENIAACCQAVWNVPFWRHRIWGFDWTEPSNRPLLMFTSRTVGIAYALWRAIRTMFPDASQPFLVIDKVFHGFDNSSRRNPAWVCDNEFLSQIRGISDAVLSFESIPHPGFWIDLTGNRPEFAIYQELLRRSGIPSIDPSHESRALTSSPGDRSNTVLGLLDAVFQFMNDGSRLEHARDKALEDAEARYSNDAGWANVQRALESLVLQGAFRS